VITDPIDRRHQADEQQDEKGDNAPVFKLVAEAPVLEFVDVA
jgi:hypothetical protein